MTIQTLAFKPLAAVFFLALGIYAQPVVASSEVDNIVVVKKHRYNNMQRSSMQIKAFQTLCNTHKIASYKQTRLPIYAPQAQDDLSMDDINRLDDITVTEYFSGTSYARYEEGQTWHPSFSTKEGEKVRDTEFYCRLVPKKIMNVEIRTPTHWIVISNLANNEQGQVTYEAVKPGWLDRIPPKRPAKNLIPEKVPNSNFECLSRPGLGSCYLKDAPIHAGSNREVVLKTAIPARGENPMSDAMHDLPVPALNAIGAFKQGDMAKVFDHVSTVVAKEIPLIRFELPQFAQSYKVIRK